MVDQLALFWQMHPQVHQQVGEEMGTELPGREHHLALLTGLGLVALGALWELRWRRLVHTLSKRDLDTEELIERALHDPLTNLPNRTLLEDRIEQALVRAKRNQTTVAVLFIDLDNFKSINDAYGHLVGDQMLIATGQLFQQHLRASDTAARLGGDEFIALLEMKQNSEAAMMVAERLRTALHMPLVLEPEPLTLTASIGIAIAHSPNVRINELLLEADRALLEAKQRGKDQVILAKDGVTRELASIRTN